MLTLEAAREYAGMRAPCPSAGASRFPLFVAQIEFKGHSLALQDLANL